MCLYFLYDGTPPPQFLGTHGIWPISNFNVMCLYFLYDGTPPAQFLGTHGIWPFSNFITFLEHGVN